MMNQLNNYVQLIGHIGNQPELSQTKNGNPYVKISLATNESYLAKNGQWENNTHWHNLICWGKKAEKLATEIMKGDQLLVRGKLEQRKYEDANNQTKYITQVVVGNFMPMRKKEVV